jgi:nucleotide-binding universal stress UspA family protein
MAPGAGADTLARVSADPSPDLVSASSRPLVVGYAGSDESRDALALTRELAGLTHAPVVAVSVITAAPIEVDVRTYTNELREHGEQRGREALEGLAGLDHVETVSIPAPSPARELDRIATEREAAIAVLGSTHRGPIGRVMPGTVADRLLAGGAYPVAIAPKGFRASGLRLNAVGVAFDGSAESRAALALAAQLARAAGARLDLIAVVNPAMPAELAFAAQGYAAFAATPAITRQQVDRMWGLAGAAVKELVPDAVAATIHVLEGAPAELLLERAEHLDLLAIGSRGYGPLGRVLMGSVSSVVLRECVCPVIVTPRPEAEPDPTAAPGVREAVSA